MKTKTLRITKQAVRGGINTIAMDVTITARTIALGLASIGAREPKLLAEAKGTSFFRCADGWLYSLRTIN